MQRMHQEAAARNASILATDDNDDVLPRASLGLQFRPTSENVAGPVHTRQHDVLAPLQHGG